MRADHEDVYVGIDLGTQSVRAIASTADGQVLGTGNAPLSSMRDGVRHEQDPAQWWSATAAACRAAVSTLPSPGAVRAVAVCGTSGTVLLADADGTAQGTALMYDDGRAGAQAELLNAAPAAPWASFGYGQMQRTWGLPKILWLLENAAGDAGRPIHQSDFITWQLAGHQVAADTSNALKSGCDVATETWPADVLEQVGLAPGLLPDLVRPGSVLGTVSDAAARATGLPVGAAIVAGMTDSCAAQLAAGASTPGSWNSVLGTTLALKGVTSERLNDPLGVVYSHRSPDGQWLPGGASSVGAGIFAQLFGPQIDHATLTGRFVERYVPQRPPTDVLCYPLASERGERFPFQAAGAERFVVGDPRDEADLYAAVLLGVALIEKLCFAYLGGLGADVSGPVHLTGGTASNRAWSQLRADVLARPVVLPRITEPAFGMAVLAATHEGRRLGEATERMVQASAVLQPDPAAQAWVPDVYARLTDELQDRGWLPVREGIA